MTRYAKPGKGGKIGNAGGENKPGTGGKMAGGGGRGNARAGGKPKHGNWTPDGDMKVGGTRAIARDIYRQEKSLIMPQVRQGQDRLMGNLEARGIPVGSKAYNKAWNSQRRETESVLSRLASGARVAAGQEQTRRFNLDQSTRNQWFNELAALAGGSFTPQSTVPGSAPAVNYSGHVANQYNADMNQYQAEQQQTANAWGTAGNFAGSLMAKCAREAKDIHAPLDAAACARIVRDMPLYRWSYKPEEGPAGEHVGPMADDFRRLTGMGTDEVISLIDANGVLMGALQSALRRVEALEAKLATAEVI